MDIPASPDAAAARLRKLLMLVSAVPQLAQALPFQYQVLIRPAGEMLMAAQPFPPKARLSVK
jgi:hypothetical protein